VVKQGPEELEKAVKLTLRRLGQATRKQILDNLRETYPLATKYRILKILKESDYAESRVAEITVTGTAGPYRRQSQVWVYKSAQEEQEAQRAPLAQTKISEVERTFFRNQLFSELVSVLNQLHSPIIVTKVIAYSVWKNRPESEITELLGANDYSYFEAFYKKVDSRNKFYVEGGSKALQDAVDGTSRREIIDDVKRLFDRIPWLKVRNNEVNWPTE
jgi:hypothetical protein